MPPPIKRDYAFELLVRNAKIAEEERKKVNSQGENRKCEMCRGTFLAKRTWQKFCSSTCKNIRNGQIALAEKETTERRILELEETVEAREKEIINLRAEIARLEKQ